MSKKGLDWLIETAEAQLQEILREIQSGELERSEKRTQRIVMIQLLGSLQKLYFQAGIRLSTSRSQLKEQLAKLTKFPEASRKGKDTPESRKRESEVKKHG